MMIRINLLPTRQAQKREMGRQYLVLVAGTLLLTLGGNYLWYRSRDAELQRRVEQINAKRVRISELDKIIGEVNNLKKRQEEVRVKLEKLGELQKKKVGPVRMLDALATSMPKKAWITEFVEDKGGVKLNGMAESHEDVSELMKSLGNIVWTNKGMARVVERKRDATTRVELLTAEGSMVDFPATDLGSFFTGVELKSSEVVSAGTGRDARKFVKFEINMAANYAI